MISSKPVTKGWLAEDLRSELMNASGEENTTSRKAAADVSPGRKSGIGVIFASPEASGCRAGLR